MNRRIAAGLLVLALFASQLAFAADEPASPPAPQAASCAEIPNPRLADGKAEKPPVLMQNEDSTNFFFYHDIRPGDAGPAVDRYVDVLAASGVTLLLCNTNARRTNYRGNAWQAFWDGFDPDGPDDQPFLATIPLDARQRHRKLVANMLEVHRQGIDFPARVIERCRHHGIAPWITLRMNDVHYNDNLDHPFHSPLWRKPELFRQGDAGYFARALDYAHPEVRDHYRALIEETLARYDIDGLEFDFMREPYLFSVGKEAADRPLLTAWLREMRKLVDETARRRGHPIKLGVRVPSCPNAALGLGLDAPTWAREGLVDQVVVTPRWASLQFDMPLGAWRELLGDRVTLAGGLEVSYRPSPDVLPRPVTAEQATGAAVAVLAAGADAVYLFNYFQDGHPGWPIAEYERTLKALASLDEALKLPRRHAVTYRDIVAPGEAYHPPLPATGKEFAFELPLGPKPPADWQADATIEVAALPTDGAPPAVSVGGVAAEFRTDEPLENGHRLLTYSVPLAALAGHGRETITVAAQSEITLTRVEVGLRPGS
ncbi:MAG TPA: hypothetical protein VHY91_14790 [Pirellulales bacterium]|jgi:hypothetical protein|nr:hypothetical protein [Pirellulales bacterium]